MQTRPRRSARRRDAEARKLDGAKLAGAAADADDQPRGGPLLTIDSVGAGVGEQVLIVIEGRAPARRSRRKPPPSIAAIIGIVDRVTMRAERRMNDADCARSFGTPSRGTRVARASSAPAPSRAVRDRAVTGHAPSHADLPHRREHRRRLRDRARRACNHCDYCKSHGH
jgi:ethanolamine utilization protein EutN